MRLLVERCEDARSVQGLRTEWNRLLEQSRSDSVFLSWEWQFAWWRQLAPTRGLDVLTVRGAGGELLGIAPLCLGRREWPPERVLTFLGTEHVSSEYLDIIAHPSVEREVAGSILDALIEDPGWDSVRLSDVLPTSIVMNQFRAAAVERGVATFVEPGQQCPYLPLPESFEAFLASLSHKTRGNLRRLTRKLADSGVRWDVVERAEELPTTLETLYRLHGERWRRDGLAGNFTNPRVRSFHEEVAGELAPQGRMRVYSLRREGATLASLYALEFKGALRFYQSGFDPAPAGVSLKGSDYSPGFVLIGYCIEDSIRRGLREFDFLRGLEDYKSRWSKAVRTTCCLSLAPPGRPIPWARLQIRRGVLGAKRTVKQWVHPLRSSHSRNR